MSQRSQCFVSFKLFISDFCHSNRKANKYILCMWAFILLFNLCMYLCVSVCTHICVGVPKGNRRGLWIARAGVIGGCEPSDVIAENQRWVLSRVTSTLNPCAISPGPSYRRISMTVGGHWEQWQAL